MVLVIDVDDFAGVGLWNSRYSGSAQWYGRHGPTGKMTEEFMPAGNVNARARLDSIDVDFTGRGSVNGGPEKNSIKPLRGNSPKVTRTGQSQNRVRRRRSTWKPFFCNSTVRKIDLEMVPLSGELTTREPSLTLPVFRVGCQKANPNDFLSASVNAPSAVSQIMS